MPRTDPQVERRLPDVNAETNPFALVQRHLDEAAYLNLYVGAEARSGHVYGARNVFDLEGGFVLQPAGRVHPLDAVVSAARVSQAVGAPLGSFRGRWIFASDGFDWSPGREPSPVLFDPESSQRFAMQEAELSLDGTGDRLLGYGMGKTHPVTVDGRREVLAGGVGNVTGGAGKLAGSTGTFVLNGRITAGLGFEGNLTVRLLDPDRRIHGASLPALPAPRPLDGDDATYVVVRGQKRDPTVPSLYSYAAGNPVPIGLDTPAQVFSVEYRAEVRVPEGLRTELRIGAPIGTLDASVLFDVTDPPGTAERPNVFRTRNTYRFTDERGRVVGGILANVELGRTFDLSLPALPGQGGIRYGGVGPIVGSSGVLAGAQGMVAVNSVVGLSPHALSLLNVLRIVDPDGSFRRSAGSRG